MRKILSIQYQRNFIILQRIEEIFKSQENRIFPVLFCTGCTSELFVSIRLTRRYAIGKIDIIGKYFIRIFLLGDIPSLVGSMKKGE